MINTRALVIVAFGLVLSTQSLQGQGRPQYHDFQLGRDLAPSDAKTIHQRPAAIQELEWPPPCFVNGSTAPQNDPIRMIGAISTAYGPSLQTRTATSQIEDKGILPWGLRRAGTGVRLAVSGIDIFIQRNRFKLSKSVTF